VISQIKPIENKILVEVQVKPDSLKNGYVMPSHLMNENKYHPKFGLVLSVPEGETEIKKGDTVYFHYLVLESAKPQADEGLLLVERKRTAILMLREDIFFIQRSGIRIPLNGYCLLSPVQNKKDKIGKYSLTDRDIQDVSAAEGTIRLIGENEQGLKEGDLVIYETNSDAPVEFALTATTEPLYRMQVNEILMTLSEKLNLN
jgi:co-chaperonin GroES (HSP10)